MCIRDSENKNLQDLKNELSSYVEELKTQENNVVITNQRHFHALQKSLESVQKVEEAVHAKISTELLAYEPVSYTHLDVYKRQFYNF